MTMPGLSIALPDEVLDALVDLVAARVLEQLSARDPEPVGRWLTVGEAAAYLRCGRQRIYDLRSAGRLSRHGDGRKALIDRHELDALATGSAAPTVLPPSSGSRIAAGPGRMVANKTSARAGRAGRAA